MGKALITGGAGFIGSHLADYLEKIGEEVVIVDDLSGGSLDNVHGKTVMSMDCRNFNGVDSIVQREKLDTIYHLAANAAENKAQFSPVDITSRNYDAFIKVITAGIRHGMKKFVFTSSIAVYGEGQTPFKETDVPKPEDLYGISKLAAEDSIKVLSKVHGFEYSILRPHNVYGPRQNMRDPYRNVVTIFMNKLLRGEKLPIFGDGEQIRQFTFIDDIISQIAEAKSGTWNIGANKHYTINELAKTIEHAAHIENGREYLPERHQEVKIAIANNVLMEETPIFTGIYKTWQWAKEMGPQELVKTELEIKSDKAPKAWL